jgi:hypothetical protein
LASFFCLHLQLVFVRCTCPSKSIREKRNKKLRVRLCTNEIGKAGR